MTGTTCPDCDGDGATYEWARVGQHATPFVCLRCDGSGEVTDPDIPIEEVEVRALREALAREIARANALQDALDEEREKDRLQELAWEEGFHAGVHDEWEYQHLDAPSAPTLNPYRKETTQ